MFPYLEFKQHNPADASIYLLGHFGFNEDDLAADKKKVADDKNAGICLAKKASNFHVLEGACLSGTIFITK